MQDCWHSLGYIVLVHDERVDAIYKEAKNILRMITCALQVRKDLEDPMQLCPPSVLQERKYSMQAKCLVISKNI